MANIYSRTRERRSIKGRVTAFAHYLDAVQIPLNELALTELKERTDALAPSLNLYYLKHESVLALLEQDEHIDDAVQSHEEKRIEFEQLYFAQMARARQLIKANEPPPPVAPPLVQQPAYINPRHQMALPKIGLPTFSGAHDSWMEFRDKFTSIVHNSTIINDDVERFHYLHSCLTGEAALVIQNIEYTSENYRLAWNMLCNRFDNPCVLMHSHIKSIFGMERIKKESATSLREMLDALTKHLGALHRLGERGVDLYSAIMIYIATSRFDSVTAREWEEKYNYTTAPTLDNLMQFLRDKADLLFTLDMKRATESAPQAHTNKQTVPVVANKSYNNLHLRSHAYLGVGVKCFLCKQAHSLKNCHQFVSMNPNQRFNKIKELKLCINCFGFNHLADTCPSSTCRKCDRKHNTLLHFDSSADPNPRRPPTSTYTHLSASNAMTSQHCYSLSNGLLSTALIYIFDKKNQPFVARVLLDSGSQAQYITNEFAARLNLTLIPFKMPIMGIANVSSISKFCCSAKLSSLHNSYEFETRFHVLPCISGDVPSVRFNISSWAIPHSITMADPLFYEPGPIDALLGAEHFLALLTHGQMKLAIRGPILQNTKLGWIISGTAAGANIPDSLTFTAARPSLSDLLTRFWQIEESGVTDSLITLDECDNHFRTTTTRGKDGRIIVQIPTKNLDTLGNTREIAYRRFLQLERRLEKNPDLKSQYHAFIREYLDMNHMTPSLSQHDNASLAVFLPHHAVHNELSLSTKLRVVFNGSAISDTGVTWNDCQVIGPRIQQELFSILIRFRKHRYAFSADIAKMFRMVEIHPSQWSLQQIFWRFKANDSITAYSLKTVTYGTAAASYLAIRALFQVADDVKERDPITAECIRDNFYVDDYLSGADSVEEAQTQALAVRDALLSACFELRKWRSNAPEIISGFNEPSLCNLDFGNDLPYKTLGLQWKPESDTLTYRICLPTPKIITKRVLLSIISKVYDPLGLVAPCTVKGKILMQQLWSDKVGWDEPLSTHACDDWVSYYKGLSGLNRLSIVRHAISSSATRFELHAFADASTKAYGGCVYIRSINLNDSYTTSLLCSKSKVSPLKTLSIPRLELCAALLLARLTKRVIESLKMSSDMCDVFLWSDSMVVLAWLKHCPSTLDRFVANRVSEIQTLTDKFQWNHVISSDNPADLVSRGVSPQDLQRCSLWWSGAKWLSEGRENWPPIGSQVAEPAHSVTLSCIAKIPNDFGSCIQLRRFSNWSRLLRTTSYVLRFVNNLRSRKRGEKGCLLHLSVQELNAARTLLLRISQNDAFVHEISCLRKNSAINASSNILSLSPFLDADGLLRVGGRLSKASIPYEHKHTILLPRSHWVTELIFRYEHLKLYHVGPLGLLNAVHQVYWPIAGRNMARKIVRNCVTCCRASPRPAIPKMGDLPRDRVVPSYPFQKCAVDYAGPFTLKSIQGRGCKTYKSFIAVFVCMATKAAHLELVTELSSAAFIAALRRLTSRRGLPAVMYSDNGTNFTGAYRELKDLIRILKSSAVAGEIENMGIKWRFIPARSPHFGGLWEAGVRSVKYHLRRVLGLQILTYEDFHTLLVQVEAILNSRPLTSLSDDPTDFSCLTPAHFLIGRSLTSLPMMEHDFHCSSLSRYEHVQRMAQHLWRRWKEEYLRTLQRRTKWQRSSTRKDIQKGDLVILLEDNSSPLRWRLARVDELFPGDDGVTRVISVRTSTGIFKRSVHRVCPLPKADEQIASSPEDIIPNEG